MIGRKFGRLSVIELAHLGPRHQKFYLCRCDCGGDKIVQASLMSSGNTRSCGCLVKDAATARRIPNNHSEVTAIILGYKRHAKSRGIEWHLTREEVDALVRLPCHYCGVRAGNIKKTKNSVTGFWYNGIDRRLASEPYRASNVVPCCGFCNRAKQSLNDLDFIAWAKRVAAQWASLAEQRSKAA